LRRYNTGSMIESISPARSVHGVITVPGDKSISHRYAMLTSIAEGESLIHNYATGADCRSTLACMGALGIQYETRQEQERDVLVVQGKGLHGLRAASGMLDAGNSGSTIRMLSGILAAQPFATTIAGDESLAQRPMRRIITPLQSMGARIKARDGHFPPLEITGSPLRGIAYDLPVASAQVKSCILLAGLYAEGETSVQEPVPTRDHTEIALRELGADITLDPRRPRIRSGAPLVGKQLVVPGDLSSAAFFLVAASLLPGSDLIISGVGLNPTRTTLLDVLIGMGASIKILHIEQVNGELIGSLQIRASSIKGGTISGATTAAVIDEIPVLAILGAASENGLLNEDAAELRLKETDRIEAVTRNLARMGVKSEATESTLAIAGRQQFHAAEIDSFGDHRIAMAFSIAALLADGPSTIVGSEAASVSFPEFYTTLHNVTA
jgi:3-phosphoshikimate 1-carboxyvinyltransferase